MNAPPAVTVVAAIIRRNGRILLSRRQPGVHLEGFWEFPGGKVEPGESLETALVREIREELEIEIEVGPLYLEQRHQYADRLVHLHFFVGRVTRGEPRCRGVAEFVWIQPNELVRYSFPPANAAVVASLLAESR